MYWSAYDWLLGIDMMYGVLASIWSARSNPPVLSRHSQKGRASLSPLAKGAAVCHTQPSGSFPVVQPNCQCNRWQNPVGRKSYACNVIMYAAKIRLFSDFSKFLWQIWQRMLDFVLFLTVRLISSASILGFAGDLTYMLYSFYLVVVQIKYIFVVRRQLCQCYVLFLNDCATCCF